jgi:hypothetical protein
MDYSGKVRNKKDSEWVGSFRSQINHPTKEMHATPKCAVLKPVGSDRSVREESLQAGNFHFSCNEPKGWPVFTL